jgi:hypothetical protein
MYPLPGFVLYLYKWNLIICSFMCGSFYSTLSLWDSSILLHEVVIYNPFLCCIVFYWINIWVDPINGHLRYLQFGSIRNSIAMNVLVYICRWDTWIFVEYSSKSENSVIISISISLYKVIYNITLIDNKMSNCFPRELHKIYYTSNIWKLPLLYYMLLSG